MKSLSAIVFPFDLHGSPGTSAGAKLLADALREMLADAEEESKPTRNKAYRNRVRIVECSLDKPARLKKWKEHAQELLAPEKGRFQIYISGNHLGSLPIYESLSQRDLVLQFDAHLDIFELDDCEEDLSHGNFLLHAGSLPGIVNLGHRDLFLTDKHIRNYYLEYYSSASLSSMPEKALAKIRKRIAAAERVWIDIDCDVFDPSYFPAVSEPEPMGVSPVQVVGLLEALWSEKVVGFALSEFLPQRDGNDRCLATLCWLLEWVMLKNCQ